MRYAFKAPSRDQIPSEEDLLALMEGFRGHGQDLAARLEAGMPIEDWRKEFEFLLVTAHRYAYEFGFRRARRVEPSLETARRVAEEVFEGERGFVDGFEADLREGKVSDPARRMALYAGKLRGTANGGWIDGLDDDAPITWHLGVGDHCADCPPLAKGSPYTKQTLTTTPGANQTACLFNCLCWLSSGEETGFQRVGVWYLPNQPAEAGGEADEEDGPREAPAVVSTERFDLRTAALYTGNMTVRWSDDPEEARAMIRHVFGRDLNRVTLARLVAAPAGSIVQVSSYDGGVLVGATQDEIGLDTARIFYRRGDEVIVYQWLFYVNKQKNLGWGTRIAGLQLKNYIEFGLTEATMDAIGEPNTDTNGYYAWPKLGYNIGFDEEQLARVKEAGFTARDTHQLFLRYGPKVTREGELTGRQWRFENGSGGKAVFNLRRGSLHWAILRAALAEKGIRI